MLETMTDAELYCPQPLVTEPEAVGLVTTHVATALGPMVVRHSAERTGETALVLLHGAAGSWTTWTPLLAELAPTTDLVIPDLPGWGDSPLPPQEDAITIEALVSALGSAVRALGYRSWNLVGHSLGATLALHLAGREPAATHGVLLVSATTFAVFESVRHPVRRFTLLPGFTLLHQLMRVFALAPRASGAFVRAVARIGLLRFFVRPLFRHPRRIDATVIAALGREARPRAFVLAARRASDQDPSALWTQIACPVLSLSGERDVFVADSDAAVLAAVIPGFRAARVAGSGHFAHLEQPRIVAVALRTLR
jgi:pimeloyl-ACP methyl ester carboxylesterase